MAVGIRSREPTACWARNGSLCRRAPLAAVSTTASAPCTPPGSRRFRRISPAISSFARGSKRSASRRDSRSATPPAMRTVGSTGASGRMAARWSTTTTTSSSIPRRQSPRSNTPSSSIRPSSTACSRGTTRATTRRSSPIRSVSPSTEYRSTRSPRIRPSRRSMRSPRTWTTPTCRSARSDILRSSRTSSTLTATPTPNIRMPCANICASCGRSRRWTPGRRPRTATSRRRCRPGTTIRYGPRIPR